MATYTWRDLLVVEDATNLFSDFCVVLPGNDRDGRIIHKSEHAAGLALGYHQTKRKVHAMTHPEFTDYFNLMWPRQEALRHGQHAERWEVFYDALLTEYQARATSLNGMTPPGMSREEFRALWETPGKQDEAYARAVQGAFNATEVTG